MTERTPLSRVRASDQIFLDLQDRVLSGALAPGDRLPSERGLAETYGVSVNTVRESIRGLSLMGLVEVRHGLGAIVTVSPSALVGNALGMLLRLQRSGLTEVVRLAGVLHQYAASLAIDAADDADLERLADAVESIRPEPEHVERFLTAFVACAHDPLLAALSATLDHIVTSVVHGTEPDLTEDVEALAPIRAAMLNALRERNSVKLTAATADHQVRSAAIIARHPRLRDVRLSDPLWTSLLAGLVG